MKADALIARGLARGELTAGGIVPENKGLAGLGAGATQTVAYLDLVGGQILHDSRRRVDLGGQVERLRGVIRQAEGAAFQVGELQRAAQCAIQHGLQIQVRDGGCDDLGDGGQFLIPLADLFLRVFALGDVTNHRQNASLAADL